MGGTRRGREDDLTTADLFFDRAEVSLTESEKKAAVVGNLRALWGEVRDWEGVETR